MVTRISLPLRFLFVLAALCNCFDLACCVASCNALSISFVYLTVGGPIIDFQIEDDTDNILQPIVSSHMEVAPFPDLRANLMSPLCDVPGRNACLLRLSARRTAQARHLARQDADQHTGLHVASGRCHGPWLLVSELCCD